MKIFSKNGNLVYKRIIKNVRYNISISESGIDCFEYPPFVIGDIIRTFKDKIIIDYSNSFDGSQIGNIELTSIVDNSENKAITPNGVKQSIDLLLSTTVQYSDITDSLEDDSSDKVASAKAISLLNSKIDNISLEGYKDNTFNDSKITELDWDNIPAGTDLENLSWIDIVKKQVYYDSNSIISNFNISSFSDEKEIGNIIPGDFILSFMIKNPEKVKEIVLYNHNNEIIPTFGTRSPQFIEGRSWTIDTPKKTSWKLSLLDNDNRLEEKEISINWKQRVLFGESEKSSLTSVEDLISFNDYLFSDVKEISLNFIGNDKYKYFIISALSDEDKYILLDSKTEDFIPTLYSSIPFVDEFGVSRVYCIYRIYNLIHSNLNCVVRIN